MSIDSTGTIRRISRHRATEIKVRKSRFKAEVHPASSRAAISTVLSGIREASPEATHHCYAYRLGPDRQDFRYDDDGEPSGTAGPPILRQIDRLELTDVIVVVSRFFGGVKLGTGGLIRAYGEAARTVLDRCHIVESIPSRTVRLIFDYDYTSAVMGLINRFNAEVTASDYSELTELRVSIPTSKASDFASGFMDAARGEGTLIFDER